MRKDFSLPGRRELHDNRYKDIKQHDVLDSTEHSEPVVKDEGGEGNITECFMCYS